MTNKPKTIRNI